MLDPGKVLETQHLRRHRGAMIRATQLIDSFATDWLICMGEKQENKQQRSGQSIIDDSIATADEEDARGGRGGGHTNNALHFTFFDFHSNELPCHVNIH